MVNDEKRTPEELYTLGRRLLATGRVDAASQAFAGVLAADHRHLGASLELARIAISLSRVEEARTILDRVRQFAPDDPQALVLEGLISEGSGQLDDAMDRFNAALEKDNRCFEALFNRGRLKAVQKQFESAITDLQAASTLRPEAPAPHYTLGIAYMQAGDAANSIRALNRTIEIAPHFLDGYMTLADVLSMSEQQGMAEKILRQAASIFPDAGAVYDKLAAVYIKQGAFDRAVAALRDQVRVEPDNESAYMNLATVALVAKEYQVAGDALDRLLERDPDNWRGLHLRAKFFEMADKPERAMDDLRHAIRVAPHEWKPFNDLGTLLNARAQTDKSAAVEAVKVLERACELAPPEEPAPRYNLGLAFWNSDRPDEARQIMTQVAETGPPDHPVITLAREARDAMVSSRSSN